MLAEAVFALGLRHPLPAPPPKPEVTSVAPSPTFRHSKLGTSGIRAYALAKVGPAQFACLDPLWQRESGWRPTADNHGSTAYGIPQLLYDVLRGVPARGQVDAGLVYIEARYGSPCAAWDHWRRLRWY